MSRSHSIRPATTEDREVVFALFSEVQNLHRKQYPNRFLMSEKGRYFDEFFNGLLENPEEHLTVLSKAHEVVGLVHFSIQERPENLFTYPSKSIFIKQMVVAYKRRRSGIGSCLIDHVKQEAKRLKITSIGIEYWHFNAPAKACYEKAGFKTSREVMNLSPSSDD